MPTGKMTLSQVDYLQRKNNYMLWLALKHHKTHKNSYLDFTNHSYLKAIYADHAKYIIIAKSTQCGVTEYLILRSICKAIQGKSIFYVLPTYQLVTRFVRNRIDKTINNTDYYLRLEKAAKEIDEHRRSESMTLKDIGNGAIAYVGSNSTAGFTEFPADEVIIDELDECDQKNIEMAWERLSHSDERTQIKVANPTIEGFGINKEFIETNQMEWHIKHDCNKWISFDWFKQAVEEVQEGTYIIRDKEWEWNSNRDIYLICQHCGKSMNRKQEGLWIPKYKDKLKHGYGISKLFSGTVNIVEIMERFNKGLRDDTVLQRVYNADLGKAFTARGAKIIIDMLNQCCGNLRNGTHQNAFGLCGIDVGNVLNIVIGYLMPSGQLLVSNIIELPVDINELIRILNEYKIFITVIDALPEKNFVNQLKLKYKNVFSCYYAETKKEPVDESRNIIIDRTATLDTVKESLMTKNIILPSNAASIPNFYNQMTSSTRIFDSKRNKGNGAYVWVETGPDHYFHAMNLFIQARRLISAIMK